MIYPQIALSALIIDKIFGEFKYIRHPVVIMGSYIKWFEKRFYKDNIYIGAILTISLLSITFFTIYTLNIFLESFNYIIYLLTSSLIASTTIASKMLSDSVYDIASNPQNIKYLVSRDTENLSRSDINKASIESYGENLSDGVVAPLFYLSLFGLEMAFLYKAINTLDSMVGYHTERYEKFGKFSAKLDDVANYIPARLTALFISIINLKAHKFYKYASGHQSPNAGYPISAMALAVGVKLGGDTPYFGEMKKKPLFGDGRESIDVQDIYNALYVGKKVDFLMIIILLGVIFL